MLGGGSVGALRECTANQRLRVLEDNFFDGRGGGANARGFSEGFRRVFGGFWKTRAAARGAFIARGSPPKPRREALVNIGRRQFVGGRLAHEARIQRRTAMRFQSLFKRF